MQTPDINDATPPTLNLANRATTCLQQTIQRAWGKLWRNKKQRHDMFVPDFCSSLIPFCSPEMKLLECCHPVLVYDDGLPFTLDSPFATKLAYVLLSLANDWFCSLLRSTCERSLAANANANQLPQNIPKISHPSQHGHVFPTYAPFLICTKSVTLFLHEFSYATFLLTGNDKFILIPIMLNFYGHFTHGLILITFEKAQIPTIIDTSLALKVYLNFCWSPCLRKSKSKTELAKIVDNNHWDLEKSQEYLLTNDLAIRLSKIFIKTLDSIFIKFPTSSPS